MERRGFIKNLCKAVGVAVVAPAALASTSTPAFDVDKLQKQIIYVKARRKGFSWTHHNFWMDYDVYKAHAKFMAEQEQKMWDYWYNRDYLKEE